MAVLLRFGMGRLEKFLVKTYIASTFHINVVSNRETYSNRPDCIQNIQGTVRF